MSTYVYTYRTPEDLGYKRVKLPRKEFERVIKSHDRKIKWYNSYVVYENEKEYRVERFESLPAGILNVLLIPVSVITYGVHSWSIILKDCYSSFSKSYARRTGSFSSFTVKKTSA